MPLLTKFLIAPQKLEMTYIKAHNQFRQSFLFQQTFEQHKYLNRHTKSWTYKIFLIT